MKKLLLPILLLGLLAALRVAPPLAASPTGASIGATWVVSPVGPLTSIEAAVAGAAAGDTIAVYGGRYDGPLMVDKSVRLIGYDWPVIDGRGSGSVVHLQAADSHFEGFEVRDSGRLLDKADAGIMVTAPRIVVANNRLEDVLFGVYINAASHSQIRGNEINSKDLEVARRGDGVRVWASDYVIIEDNVIRHGRDVVLWYSEGLTVRGNEISYGRYGLHLMYCDDVLIEANLLTHNSVGVFLMYSENLRLSRNTIAFNRGPSGYGIGLKDTESPTMVENLLLDNRVGIYIDTTARSMIGTGLVQGNVFAYNDVGLTLLPVVRGIKIIENSFIDNQEQVSITGGGRLQGNIWTVNGRGNYWSDYAGYDADGDGVGDIPYRADRLFDNLTDRHPALSLFQLSPAIQAVDFAARAVPFIRPQPKMVDEGPLMAPLMPEGLPALILGSNRPLGAASGGLMTLVLTLALFLFLKPMTSDERAGMNNQLPTTNDAGQATAVGQLRGNMIEAANLTKRFGRLTAVDNVSFTIQAGEAVALWGGNGAGKTTILHCLLAVLPHQGRVTIAGYETAVQGKAARRLVGFVPQQLNFHGDLTVVETMQFYARLKRAAMAPVGGLLERLGLATHAHKRVQELSGGMKQRLALAIALLTDPPLLILDEPTANLDVTARDDFLNLLAEQKVAGKTLIFSSHRPEEVMALADRVLVLAQGKLLLDSPPEQLNGQAPGWQTHLRLLLDDGDMDAAVATLQQSGFDAYRNGTGLKVAVSPRSKGEPIALLNRAGITVHDFEV